MPTTDQILQSVQSIVNGYGIFAIIWHILFYLFLAALMMKWAPSNRVSGLLLCLPLVSVSAFAWLSGNPFNGSTFLVLSVLIFIFSLKASRQAVETSQLIFFIAGVFMIAFGLIYPHFIETDSVLKYFYASPVGLIPCPTLSALNGLALMFNGFGSRSISLTLIIFGLFYGIFGVLKLEVYLDVFLALGAIILLVKYLSHSGITLQLNKA